MFLQPLNAVVTSLPQEIFNVSCTQSYPGLQGWHPMRSWQLATGLITFRSLATACRSGTWRHLHGAFTVWIDTQPDQTEGEAPQRGAFVNAEVHLRIASWENGTSLEDAADAVVAQAWVSPTFCMIVVGLGVGRTHLHSQCSSRPVCCLFCVQLPARSRCVQVQQSKLPAEVS